MPYEGQQLPMLDGPIVPMGAGLVGARKTSSQSSITNSVAPDAWRIVSALQQSLTLFILLAGPRKLFLE